MKKLLLSVALLATFVGTTSAQVTLNGIAIPSITGGTVIPVFQGSAGTYQVQGQLLPKVEGSLTSATIDASLTASVNLTYASDLTILVTSTSNIQTAEVLLQIGGFSNFSDNKVNWPCSPDCDTNVVGTLLSGTAEFAALDFSGSEYVIWIGNGYVDANPPTNSGSWNITSLTFTGIELSSSSIVSNAPVSAYAFPNPATSELNVSVEGQEVVSVSLISMDGKIVSTVNGSVAQVADLTAGMYIYEATTAAGLVVRNTFIKK